MDKQDLRERYGEEEVLVCPAGGLANLSTGLLDMSLLPGQATRFIPRFQAEGNPAWRQLIPYIVLQRGAHFWLTKRLRSQGESRLHERFSLGVGGHINPGDGLEMNSILGGFYRELEEELDLGRWQPKAPQPLGLINDDSDAVGLDHLGILFLLEVPDNVDVKIRETDKMEGRWVSAEEIAATHYKKLEGWSRLVFDHLRNCS